ncbi:MAG: serine hydrolase domain-containing protein, partial [Bacteroidota bacterium]
MASTTKLLFLILVVFPMAATAQLTTADEEMIAEFMVENGIPGLSVAIAMNGELTYAKGFGESNPAHEPVTESTIFQAASISKSLTSVLVLRHVQAGRLGLDHSVNQYLEGWQLETSKKSIEEIPTIAQLLNHTGGTNIHGFLGYRNTSKRVPDLNMILNGNKFTHIWEPKIRVTNPPNTAYDYSGGGYCVLQKIIGDIDEASFDEQMRREIFEPSHMTSSFFSTNLTPAQEQQIAIGFMKPNKPVKDGYHVYPQLAAAGLWTTPSDLTRFLGQIQHSVGSADPEALLTQASLKRLLTHPILEDGTSGPYGLGFYLLVDPETDEAHSIHHFGSNQ